MRTRAQSLIYEVKKIMGLIPPCERGIHATLEWRRRGARDLDRLAASSRAAEISVACGLYNMLRWIGWCPRCGRAVQWADHDPHSRKAKRGRRR